MTRFLNNISLPETYEADLEEKNILKFWAKEQTIEKIRKNRSEKNDGEFILHSGPVFPTGFPHSGHILNGIVKDVFTRFAWQRNLKVENTFGWDCHGLPVEYEVNKTLGIRSPQDIKDMGIQVYNEECRDFVERHEHDWQKVFHRVGNCIDFSKQNITMSLEYMEGVWRAFKQLFDKGLVYKDIKMLPYSTGCFTHLSNFEAHQNCKEVTEVGTTISVNIVDSEEKLLIWTTTPWSLVANSAICVNPKAIYVKVQVKQHNKVDLVYILSKNRLPFVFKNSSDYTVLEELVGESLKDLKYQPLFENFSVGREFPVLVDRAVTDDIGTGIVPFDEVLLESLKERGHVVNVEEVKYKKSYCWRSDTPLVNRRAETWFIRVEGIVDAILNNMSNVNWFPNNDFKEKNFVMWLKEHSRDWAVGRTANWGTPLPIWSSPSGDEIVCVGSLEELKQLTGKTNITDLHREHVDWFKIPSRTPGNPPLTRVSQVFDCWFESGALPFIQNGGGSDSYQADFVIEGIDQTCGWFYTMMVLSTALSQPAPFKNLFATGLVHEPNGTKVSKRKHNHNDAMRLIEKYGADAFRLYLLNSPLVAGEKFVIKEEGVAEIVEKLINPLFRIFKQCSSQLGCPSWVNYGYVTEWYGQHHFMDEWILSSTESLLKFYTSEMKANRMHTFLPKAMELIQQIHDWYLPLRKPDPTTGPAANHPSSLILFNVIYRYCLMLAPFAPFFTEYIYQIYRPYIIWYRVKHSIHEDQLRGANESVINQDIEVRIPRMQTVIKLVETVRGRQVIPIHYQISEIVVIHHTDVYMKEDIDLVKETIMKQCNARNVRSTKDYYEFGATRKAEIESNSSHQHINSVVQNLSDEELESVIQEEPVDVLGASIPLQDIKISYQIDKELPSNITFIIEGDLLVVVKMNKPLSYYEEGTAKEFVNRIRNLKKKRGYYPSDHVPVYYFNADKCLQSLINKQKKHLEEAANCKLQLYDRNFTTKDYERPLQTDESIKGSLIELYFFAKCELTE